MNLLREYIRELLIESVDGKIMSMIDRAEEAGYKVRLFSAANVELHEQKIGRYTATIRQQ
jgi:hypothetical protein